MPRRYSMANPKYVTLDETMRQFEKNDAKGLSNVLEMPPAGTTINGLRVHIAALIERTKDNERRMVDSVEVMILKNAAREHEINELRQEVILLKSIVDEHYKRVESEITDFDYEGADALYGYDDGENNEQTDN